MFPRLLFCACPSGRVKIPGGCRWWGKKRRRCPRSWPRRCRRSFPRGRRGGEGRHDVAAHRSSLGGEAVSTKLAAHVRHPAASVGADGSGGGGVASSTAAASVERGFPGEDYPAVLEEDVGFSLDADRAGGVKLLQECLTGPLSRRFFGGHEAAKRIGARVIFAQTGGVSVWGSLVGDIRLLWIRCSAALNTDKEYVVSSVSATETTTFHSCVPLHGFLFGSHRVILVLSFLLVLKLSHVFPVYLEHELLSRDAGLVANGTVRAKRQHCLDRKVTFPLEGDVEGGIPKVLMHPLRPCIASIVDLHLWVVPGKKVFVDVVVPGASCTPPYNISWSHVM